MSLIAYKDYTSGAFNVKRLVKKDKQELLAEDIDSYYNNVCCL